MKTTASKCKKKGINLTEFSATVFLIKIKTLGTNIFPKWELCVVFCWSAPLVTIVQDLTKYVFGVRSHQSDGKILHARLSMLQCLILLNLLDNSKIWPNWDNELF